MPAYLKKSFGRTPNKAVWGNTLLVAAFLLLMIILGFIWGFNNKSLAKPANAVEVIATNTESSSLLQYLAQDMGTSIVPNSITINHKDKGNPLTFITYSLSNLLPWSGNLPEKNSSKLNTAQMPSRFTPDSDGLFFWNRQKAEKALNIANPKVAIYSTHSAETYRPFAGVDKVPGKHGGVFVASTVVAEELSKENIGVIVDDTIHDYPDWSKSYGNSLTTASGLINNNRSVEILIDMHRDAGVSRENSVVEINGKKAAKIMLVVGSEARYKHPNWQQNKALAEKIGAKMEEMYPGLFKKVSVQTGRYNQHVSPKAILVEMGTTENTIEEIEYSSQMLAAVLAEILK